jgi:hypothetical protein
LQKELERFMRNPAHSLGPTGYGAYPPINVFEDQDGTVINPGTYQRWAAGGETAGDSLRAPSKTHAEQ